jgi:DNA-binding LacI/PurR family transcriptional regulator
MAVRSFTLRGNRGPTVGILVAWLEDSYHASIVAGALDAARDRGANLLCFAGGILGAGGRAERVFELISPENVDAVVILAGSIGNHIGAERMRAYCERFRPLPMCSIALDLEGISSVCVDNDVGMRKVLGHLFHHHQMKRVAFVRGPDANLEAERRFEVYRQTLAEAGIPFDPQLVAPGDWQPASGERAVEIFFDQRRLRVEDIDAIACANDFMALGVLDALERRGIRVPEKIALVGFDDVEEVRFTTPPLTTVRQPLHKQGREAVGLVLDQVRDGARAQKIVLSTELVTRRSCRCFARRGGLAGSTALAAPTKLGFDALLVGRRQLILADLARAARGAFSAAGTGWETRLLNALTDQLRGDPKASFVTTYEDMLRRLADAGVDLSICFEVAATLRRHLMSCVANERELRPFAEELLDDIGDLTGNFMERAQAWQRIHVQRRACALGQAGGAVLTTFDLDELARGVAESLPILGIASCYVFVFEPGGDPGRPSRRSRLVLAYDSGARGARRPEGLTYRADEIVPWDLLPAGGERSFSVASLLFHDEEIGLLVLQLGAADGYVYEALRDLFAAAIQGARLLGGQQQHASALGSVQQTLAAAILRCKAQGGEGLDPAALAAELEKAHLAVEQILTVPPPSSVASPGSSSGPRSQPGAPSSQGRPPVSGPPSSSGPLSSPRHPPYSPRLGPGSGKR